jgi:YcxB-like protein
MQVSYTLTADDIDAGVRFGQRWTKQRRSALQRMRDIFIYLFAIAGLIVYIFGMIPDSEGRLWFLSSFGVATAICAVWFVIRKGRLRSKWEKASQLGLMDRRLILSPESLTLESQGTTTTFEWRLARGVQPTEQHIFIVLSGLLLVIPRRAFQSLDDSEAFLDFARSCLPRDPEPDHDTYPLDIW